MPGQDQRLITAAGVMCYAIEPRTRAVYFLLGRERYTPGWSSGSCHWSDFGGAGKRTQTGFEEREDIAAREFLEESLGVVPLDGAICTADGVAELLRDQCYAMRVEEALPRSRARCGYIKRIAWDPMLPLRFTYTRNALLRLQDVSQRIKALEPKIPARHPFVQPGMRIAALSSDLDGAFVLSVSALEWIPEERELRAVLLLLDKDAATFTRRLAFAVNPEDESSLENYRRLVEQRTQLRATFDGLPPLLRKHPALHVRCIGEHVADVYVNDDFLEKECIAWWSMERLLQACAGGGRIYKETLRSRFTATLRVVLDEFVPPRSRPHCTIPQVPVAPVVSVSCT